MKGLIIDNQLVYPSKEYLGLLGLGSKHFQNLYNDGEYQRQRTNCEACPTLSEDYHW